MTSNNPDPIEELIEAVDALVQAPVGSIVERRCVSAIRDCRLALYAAGYPARRKAELRAIEALPGIVKRFAGMYPQDGDFVKARAALRDLGLGEG